MCCQGESQPHRTHARFDYGFFTPTGPHTHSMARKTRLSPECHANSPFGWRGNHWLTRSRPCRKPASTRSPLWTPPFHPHLAALHVGHRMREREAFSPSPLSPPPPPPGGRAGRFVVDCLLFVYGPVAPTSPVAVIVLSCFLFLWPTTRCPHPVDRAPPVLMQPGYENIASWLTHRHTHTHTHLWYKKIK
ncbi:hypothetical protein LY78DRAFT_179396 [Colletotrichum sublineola]|nr:hypothetical protein LY78DRAFT_179396 [Colletotrichum sublineola]